jgi:hypothetical protein
VLWCGRGNVSSVFARIGKCLVVTALVLSMGLHWAALQTVAWAAMLANNLETNSLCCALCKTFDGKHPCCMCKAIAAAKAAQKKSEAVASALKLECTPLADGAKLAPQAQFEKVARTNTFAESLPSKPPVPPPRQFFA